MEGLPPWVGVSPRDFVLAAAQGAQLGHQIADSTMRAWEEQARMRMASQEAAARREEAAQQEEENRAMARLAADRLEQYRQSEIANAKAGLGLRQREIGASEGRSDILQQRADEFERHNQAMEKIRETAAKANIRPEAGITTLPDAPGFTFLKNPSGALTPLVRPIHPANDLARSSLELRALNSMTPSAAEDPTSPQYQARTNAVGRILQSLRQPTTGPKRLRYNPATGKLEEVAPLPQPQGGTIPVTPTDDESD